MMPMKNIDIEHPASVAIGKDGKSILPALNYRDLQMLSSYHKSNSMDRWNVKQTDTYRAAFKAYVHQYRPPDMMLHFSFRKKASMKVARKSVIKFLRAYCRRSKQHAYAMLFYDKQHSRTDESMHVHVLIWFEHVLPLIKEDAQQFMDNIDRNITTLRSWEDEWVSYTGGTLVATHYDPSMDGAGYCWDHHDDWDGPEFVCGRNFHACNGKGRVCQYNKGGMQSQVIANWRPQRVKSPKHHFCSHRQGAKRLDCPR